MMRARYLLASLLMWISAAHAEAPAAYAFQSYPEAVRSAGNSGKPVFLYMGRHGCGYCAKTNQESFSDARLRTQLSDAFELAYIDTEGHARLQLPTGERVTEAAFAERLNVLGTPVFFALRPDGTEITRLYGFQSADALLALHAYVTGRHYEKMRFSSFVETRNTSAP